MSELGINPKQILTCSENKLNYFLIPYQLFTKLVQGLYYCFKRQPIYRLRHNILIIGIMQDIIRYQF